MVITLKDGRGVLFVPELEHFSDSKFIKKQLFEAGKSPEEISEADQITEQIQTYFTKAISAYVNLLMISYGLGTHNYALNMLNNTFTMIEIYNEIERQRRLNENKNYDENNIP